MDLSICVAGYNSKAFLEQCFDSIYNSEKDSNLTFEIIFIDDASRDASLDYVRQKFPQIITIQNEFNQGFARTNNKGIALSKGRYVLLLNADTVTKSGALSALVNFMDEHPEVGAAGPQLLNPDNSLQPSGRSFPKLGTLLSAMFKKGQQQYLTAGRDYSKVTRIDEVSGAAIIVRREVLEQIGGLDKRIFLYYEDVDWCYRIWQAGWQIYYVPQSQIIHYGGQSTAQIGLRMQLEDTWSTYYYFRKHHGWRGALGATTLFVVRDVLVFLLRLAQFGYLRLRFGKKSAERAERVRQAASIALKRLAFSLRYWPQGVSARGERKNLPFVPEEG